MDRLFIVPPIVSGTTPQIEDKTFALFEAIQKKAGVKKIGCLWTPDKGAALDTARNLEGYLGISAICEECLDVPFRQKRVSEEQLKEAYEYFTTYWPMLREVGIAVVSRVVADFLPTYILRRRTGNLNLTARPSEGTAVYFDLRTPDLKPKNSAFCEIIFP